MLDTERQLFGDRTPKGFTKLSLLGKGGIAVVWLCQNNQNTSQKVAMKQFPRKVKGASDQSSRVEIEMAEVL